MWSIDKWQQHLLEYQITLKPSLFEPAKCCYQEIWSIFYVLRKDNIIFVIYCATKKKKKKENVFYIILE